jgi:lysophospholipase L1-like esterase
MKFNKLIAIAVCASILSFTYGVVTVQYKVFPFEQLRTIKQKLSPSPSPTYSDYFYHKKQFFEQHGGHNYDVVFIGDSITDGAEWEDLFPSLKIANRGIGGDRADGVLKRLDSIYSTSASRAFIMIGINDFNAGMEVDEVFNNYMAIVNSLSEHGMKIYIQSTIFAGKRLENLNTKILELNEMLKQFATQNNAVTYINLNNRLAKDSLLSPIYSRDDVHLNGNGYAVWKDTISPYLK